MCFQFAFLCYGPARSRVEFLALGMYFSQASRFFIFWVCLAVRFIVYRPSVASLCGCVMVWLCFLFFVAFVLVSVRFGRCWVLGCAPSGLAVSLILRLFVFASPRFSC